MAVATKKRLPMEAEPGEGKAYEMKESPEEEVREGAEPDDAPKAKTNRKRSPKGAKNTKAPMDSDCGCGGKKGTECDGNCGGYAKKDRNDALSPQEYLAACDLGIQNRSRAYIRSCLDAAERLDLKCGNGSISQGEKCHVGAASKAQANKASVGQRVKAGASLLALGAGTVGQAAFTGAAFGAGLSGNAKAAGRYTQAAAGFGALKGAGLAGIGAKRAAREELAGAATGALVGSLLSGDLQKGRVLLGGLHGKEHQ